MKVILTGCTGFIGNGIMQECIANPEVTSIIALSRRDLPITNPKIKVVIMKDFLSYSEEVLKELSGADACIWYNRIQFKYLFIAKLINLISSCIH